MFKVDRMRPYILILIGNLVRMWIKLTVRTNHTIAVEVIVRWVCLIIITPVCVLSLRIYCISRPFIVLQPTSSIELRVAV